MSYLKLLSARRKSGQQPSMKPVDLTREQRALAAQGKCILCSTANGNDNSYLCDKCQAKDTIEEIRDDISALRHKILGQSGETK